MDIGARDLVLTECIDTKSIFVTLPHHLHLYLIVITSARTHALTHNAGTISIPLSYHTISPHLPATREMETWDGRMG